jgi:NADH dehydrogenase
MRGPDILKDLETSYDHLGRVRVLPELCIKEDERIFVIGDAAIVSDGEKNLPGTAPVAIQEAAHVCKTIKAHLAGRKRGAFKYFDRGMLATIGKKLAIARIGRLELSGHLAWVTWSLVHILYLITFRNKVLVFINWIYYYFTGGRGARIIHSKDYRGDGFE